MSLFGPPGEEVYQRQRRYAPRRFFGRTPHSQRVDEALEFLAKSMAESADEEPQVLHEGNDASKSPLSWDGVIREYKGVVDVFDFGVAPWNWTTPVTVTHAKARQILEKYLRKNADGTWSVSREGAFESQPEPTRESLADFMRNMSDDDA